MRASRGGLGDATQGAGTTILRQISHTYKDLSDVKRYSSLRSGALLDNLFLTSQSSKEVRY